MTIQEFIAVWQAQPFRAFRVQTARGNFDVNHPLAAAMTVQMRIAVVDSAGAAQIFSLAEIAGCEVFGPPTDLATAVSAVAPETLARNAQVLATAAAADMAPEPEEERAPKYDAGVIQFLSSFATDGVHLVHVAVNTRDSLPMFSTVGTRWNVHGIEAFENGSSLYLHHLDHPLEEQRIILWPPDKGTFESFAEAKTMAALGRELHRRDAALAAKPAKIFEPDAAYFRKILPEYPVHKRDGRAEAFGDDLEDIDPDRYELALEKTETTPGVFVNNPRLYDNHEDEFLFDLSGTEWETTAPEGIAPETLKLRHRAGGKKTVELRADFKTHTAMVGADEKALPLAFIERHLGNFTLYPSWDAMVDYLRAGPAPLGQPDVVFPGPDGFRVEMWAGDRRCPLPFLQPRIVDLEGRTVFDLRATPWSAMVRVAEKAPVVTLRFLSDERESPGAAAHLAVAIDLVTHRVTCAGLEGSTSLGMLQALVRHVRGVKWMQEDLPKWFEKGRLVPSAESAPPKKRASREKR